MPRLPPRLLIHALRKSPFLALLLPICRDLSSARNELRWLTEHISATIPTLSASAHHSLLRSLCLRRRAGEPLQYILGTQPFGPLDIKCRPGVLVPRAETEAYTMYLADMLVRRFRGKGVRVLDLCTGTGCIPLLLYTKLFRAARRLRVTGVDISPTALSLSDENLEHNMRLGVLPMSSDVSRISFEHGDVFENSVVEALVAEGPWHVLTCNPPYISATAWHDSAQGLSRSTRKFEPRLALTPAADLPRSAECAPQDVFYERVLAVARQVQSQVVLLEVGDVEQAVRVLRMLDGSEAEVEVWRDWPDMTRLPEEDEDLLVQKRDGIEWRVKCRGSGNIRSIFIVRHV
ncbi:hypothetical protein TD95_002536 [Thielaviopsis punctulata]|uniref:Uncharacterized protein n=1 Tax=Thielaviopsis punctulata TaxID=72032 RepID=A0A0F4ZD62_9PEZI|nr:hypothetical protein TD95_002536 [Thielaviopsis punctulata]